MTRSLGSAARLALTLTVALALAPTLVACDAATTGGAAGGGTTAPRLTNMKLSPVAVPVGQTTVISGTVEFEDGDGNLTTLVLRFLNPDGTRTPDTDIPVQGVAGTTAGTLTLPDITVEPTEAGEYMLEALARDADGQESSVVSVKVTAQDTSNVHDVCAATGKDCTGQGVCYNLDHVACDYLDEHAFDYPECDDLTGGKKAICVSSVEDPDSYAFESSQCALTQWWSNPTRLEVDCRCGTSEIKHDACKRPYSLDVSVTWGLGPRFKDIQGTTDLRQGPLVGREWFIPMIWNTGTKQDQTMIFAVDIDTGDRRHFSGAYSDPQLGYTTVGEGPAFLEINHVVQGPDGKLYAAGGKEQQSEPRIWRIDPQTGDREVIYDALDTDTYTLCDNGSLAAGRKTVQLTSGNFAMDAKGDFYFATVSANQPGAAIVRLDGQTWACEYLTAVVKGGSLSTFTDHIGAGYDNVQFAFRALSVLGDKLYTVSDTAFIEVDLATGDRKLLSNAKPVGGFGAGPNDAEGMGDYWSFWDPHHDVFWTVGSQGATLAIAIDPVTGNRSTWPCWHPTLGMRPSLCDANGFVNPGPLGEGGVIVDPLPPHDLYLAHDGFGIVRFDVQSANSNIISL